ncbi:unnamed protein product, partial [Symbiodinium sp. KB8]
MGQTTSCCCDEEEKPPDDFVPSKRALADLDEYEDDVDEYEDDRPEEVEAARSSEPNVFIPELSILSKFGRLAGNTHLEVDAELTRGISLRESLHNFGSLWRQSPTHMDREEQRKLWSLSRPTRTFNTFISHTWRTAGRWKVLSLLFQTGSHFALACSWICVAATVVLSSAQILPMPFTYYSNLPEFQAECPFAPSPLAVGLLTSIIALLASPYLPERCGRETTCFIDVASINQADPVLMERGVYGIGGFLQVSGELQVLWSGAYLSRLWCIFELAAFRISNPSGRIRLTPIFIEAGLLVIILFTYLIGFVFFLTFAFNFHSGLRLACWGLAISPSIAVVHFMRLHVRTKHRLVSELDCFDLDQAQCSSDFDRQFIVSGIIHWYGSKEAFTAYVRGPLRSELLKSSGMPNMPLPYLLLIILGAMSSSLTTLSALWAGGAPVEVVVKQLVGGTFGLEFFWFLPCVKLTLYLCDRFSARRLGMCDFTWSVAIFLVFFGLYYAGDELATLVRALGMLPCFLWINLSKDGPRIDALLLCTEQAQSTSVTNYFAATYVAWEMEMKIHVFALFRGGARPELCMCVGKLVRMDQPSKVIASRDGRDSDAEEALTDLVALEERSAVWWALRARQPAVFASILPWAHSFQLQALSDARRALELQP